MQKVLFSVILLMIAGLLAFAYQDLLPKNDLFEELSHTKKMDFNTTWKITAYCPGRCCNTRYTDNGVDDYTNCAAIGGVTLSGLMEQGINVAAVDPDIIPLGSIIKYNNKYYVALDTGSAIKGFTLDILMPQHKTAHDFGVKYCNDIEVFVPKRPKELIEKIRARAFVKKP
ncbi:MAG: 3D domain-containing protein [Spirochaetes bacterium]|nr:3D domain-containing protein [Spirochaetota bacterium]